MIFLFTILVIGLYFVAGLPFEKRKAEADERITQSRKEYHTVAYETISSLPTVCSYNSEEWIKRFTKYLTLFNDIFVKGIMIGLHWVCKATYFADWQSFYIDN